MRKKVISIVVPVYNEEIGVGRFLDGALRKVLGEIKKKGYGTEVVLVDDGSKDKTISRVKRSELFGEEKVRIIAFSRNFGKEIALTAGLNEAKGDAVVMIDGDGQHPAGAIVEMVEKWEKGARVVRAMRKCGKNDGRGHKIGSKAFYWLLRRLGSEEIREGEMDFGLIDREVVEEFKKFGEHKRITRGLIEYLGFPTEYVEVKIEERLGGKASYSFKKLTALAVDSIVSSSRMPLAILGIVGMFITIFSFIAGLFVLIEEYILGDPIQLEWSGAVAMSIFVAFLVGIVLIGQAVTGIYVSQIHIEAKNRPLYIIDNRKSVESQVEGVSGHKNDKKG